MKRRILVAMAIAVTSVGVSMAPASPVSADSRCDSHSSHTHGWGFWQRTDRFSDHGNGINAWGLWDHWVDHENSSFDWCDY